MYCTVIIFNQFLLAILQHTYNVYILFEKINKMNLRKI